MIVTRSWLEEFISLGNITDEELSKEFVSIGHEVASVTKHTFGDKFVVGKVIECDKHPEADKLSVTKVDVGTQVLQIVCGASNVAKDQFVAVATVGAVIPSGLLIKEAKLRGVESLGMLCSASELGLPAINDGILVLDSSIGELVVGAKLDNFSLFADTVFELELTANRGDAFSIYGIARDLSARLEITIRQNSPLVQNDMIKGVGRVLQLSVAPNTRSSVMVRVLENSGLELPLITKLRVGFCDIKKPSNIELICAYATHATGVLFRAFDLENFARTDDDRYLLKITKDGDFETLVGKEKLLTIGVDSKKEFFADDSTKNIAIIAYYTEPDQVSKSVWQIKPKTDDLYTKSSKGSEIELPLGMNFISQFIGSFSKSLFFSESLGYMPAKKEIKISANINDIYSVIGEKIEKNRLVGILKRVGMSLQASADDNNFVITAPPFRHDIQDVADVSEEIVRILGIDAIKSKPLAMNEIRAVNSELNSFVFERELAKKSVANGFFEALNFLFCSKEDVGLFGFDQIDEKLGVLNPITAELDTLRPTLLISLLENAGRNSAKSHSKIALFEIGDVVDSSRNEHREIAFVFSGKKELPQVSNSAKPQPIDFFSFAQKISQILGNIELEATSEIPFLQDGQSATIVLADKRVGYMGKLHPKIANRYDLDSTYVAFVNLSTFPKTIKQASGFSKLQPISRDLTILIDKKIEFKSIKDEIKALKNPLIREVRAIDVYSDEKLADQISLTIRITIQPFEKSLIDSEINSIVQIALDTLKTKFNAEQR